MDVKLFTFQLLVYVSIDNYSIIVIDKGIHSLKAYQMDIKWISVLLYMREKNLKFYALILNEYSVKRFNTLYVTRDMNEQ